MKKFLVFLLMVIFTNGFVACVGTETETTTTEIPTTTEATSDLPTTQAPELNEISIVLGDMTYSLAFNQVTQKSVFDLMVDSEDITVVYTDSEWGPMITGVNDVLADDFHWVGFTKNGEFAMSGIDSIEYESGDVFEFTANLSNWESSFNANYESEDVDNYYFSIASYEIVIDKSINQLSNLIKDKQYILTGSPVSIDENNLVDFSLNNFSVEDEVYVKIVLDDAKYYLTNNTDITKSVFDLMVDSEDINVDYTDSEWGPYIKGVNDITEDSFHWVSFTKNGEFAMSGIDSIDYADGDVFEFTEELATWEVSFEGTFRSEDPEFYFFEKDGYIISIDKDSQNLSNLIVDELYMISGIPQTINETKLIVLNLKSFSSKDQVYVDVTLGEKHYYLNNNTEESKSVFDLMVDSEDITVVYTDSEWGPYIKGVNDITEDSFHWVSFTKNGEFAMSGIDSIDYADGDVFEFTEELATWELTLNFELTDKLSDYLVFHNAEESLVIYYSDLPDSLSADDLVIGFIYNLTAFVDIEKTDSKIVLNPTDISIDAIEDFTELYSIAIGDIFILQFTVTSFESSSAFGSEFFAKDINNLSSKDLFPNMPDPANSDYIFYSLPNGYDLTVGQTYYGKFIYQVNAPSTYGQITLYEEDILGNELDKAITKK